MIVYADTSALVKLFVVEENSQATQDMFRQAQVVGTGLLTQAELSAALARGARRGLFSREEALEARRQLATVWPTWIHITLDDRLVSRAAALAWDHGLRGYDAVHLAAALTWQERIASPIALATFDLELWKAARQIGLTAWPEGWAAS
jgi:predicted nucleic acid-binding protein